MSTNNWTLENEKEFLEDSVNLINMSTTEQELVVLQGVDEGKDRELLDEWIGRVRRLKSECEGNSNVFLYNYVQSLKFRYWGWTGRFVNDVYKPEVVTKEEIESLKLKCEELWKDEQGLGRVVENG